jgi:hypothetical protein
VKLLRNICGIKEYYLLDVLMAHVLKRLEAFPDAMFRESELVAISKKSFNQLVKDGSLEFNHYDKNGSSYFSDRIGDGGVERTVRIRNNKVAAFSPEADVATLELTKPEITYYRFNINKLIGQIRTQNKLEEQMDLVSDRLFFVGSAETTDGRVSIYLGLFDSVDSAENSVRGLPRRVSTYARYIVITPFLKIEKQGILKDFEASKVRQLCFGDAFQEKDFKFKSKSLASGTSGKQPFSLKLTGIVNGKGRSRKHLIKIAGKDGELTDALFIILLRFVEGVMKTKSGQVAVSSLTGEGVVHEEGYKQYIGRLRERLNALFPDFNFHELIENREGSYRLAVHKDSIDYDLPMLKKLMDNGKIGNIVKRLPSLRRKKA